MAGVGSGIKGRSLDDPNLVGPLTYDWSVTHDSNPFGSPQHGTDPTFPLTPDQAGTGTVDIAVSSAPAYLVGRGLIDPDVDPKAVGGAAQDTGIYVGFVQIPVSK